MERKIITFKKSKYSMFMLIFLAIERGGKPSPDVVCWKCPGTGIDSTIERILRLTKGFSSHLVFDTRNHFMLNQPTVVSAINHISNKTIEVTKINLNLS